MVTTNLSAYPFTLRGTGAGELPDQVTRVITASVKEKQITEKTFLRLNEGALEGYVFLFPLVLPLLLFLFLRYGLQISNNWIRYKGLNFQQPTTPTSSPPPAPCVKTSYEVGFESGHSFPVHSLQDNDFSSNSFSVDVGSRSRNTSFNSTTNENRRVRGMIASLERSSGSEDDNEGGRKRSSSSNKIPRNSTS